MAQLNRITVGSEWVDFSEITTLESDVNYYIQNRGRDLLIACEGTSTPTKDDGIIIRQYELLKFKKGAQNLYLKCLDGKTNINISNEG